MQDRKFTHKEIETFYFTSTILFSGLERLVFENNVGEDGLSSQLTYKVNIDCLYCIIKLPLLQIKNSTELLETLKRTDGKSLWGDYDKSNKLQLQIASKITLSAIDHQGNTFNTNIAKVQAQNVVFWPLDDIEVVDWTSTNKFVRLSFWEDIHHSSILKLAIEKTIQKGVD